MKGLTKNENGFSLIEVLAALAIIAMVTVAFLSALATASRGIIVADERTTAESLARSQMEYVKGAGYNATSYDPAAIPQAHIDAGYSATIDAVELGTGPQKITVTVSHNDEEIITLEGYKVDR